MNPKEFKREDLKEIKFLGEGTYGKVYLAEYHGEKYAIKKISKTKIDKVKELSNYLQIALKREIDIQKIMSQFENSVKFYLNTKDDNDYILIFELCDKTLEDLLKEKKHFTSDEILHNEWIEQSIQIYG